MILLGCDFNIEYLLSEKMGHTDSFSRLNPRFKRPLEDRVIASLKSEKEIKYVLWNIMGELPVT